MFVKALPAPLKPLGKPLEQILVQYNVKKLYLFGSVLTSAFDNAHSDIDMIVEFDETKLPHEQIGELYLDFCSDLEQLFQRKVDVLRNKNFKNPYFQKSLNKTKVLVYG